MKVFVATNKTQGQRASDFCFAREGELVHFPFVCDTDGHDPDGPCGCGRAWSGLETHKGTTTARVVSRRLTKRQLASCYADSLKRAGFGEIDCSREADVLSTVASLFKVGAVVEYRNGQVFPR